MDGDLNVVAREIVAILKPIEARTAGPKRDVDDDDVADPHFNLSRPFFNEVAVFNPTPATDDPSGPLVVRVVRGGVFHVADIFIARGDTGPVVSAEIMDEGEGRRPMTGTREQVVQQIERWALRL